jgi:hypothetical protein
MTGPSPGRPRYSKQREDGGRNLYCVVADEGWRQRILCDGMYGDLADWLITQIQGRPMPGPRAATEAGPARRRAVGVALEHTIEDPFTGRISGRFIITDDG